MGLSQAREEWHEVLSQDLRPFGGQGKRGLRNAGHSNNFIHACGARYAEGSYICVNMVAGT